MDSPRRLGGHREAQSGTESWHCCCVVTFHQAYGETVRIEVRNLGNVYNEFILAVY